MDAIKQVDFFFIESCLDLAKYNNPIWKEHFIHDVRHTCYFHLLFALNLQIIFCLYPHLF